MAHSYEVGTRAWQPDTTEGWISSEVEEKLVDGENVTLVFQLENGEVRQSSSVPSLCWKLIKLCDKVQNGQNDAGGAAGGQQPLATAFDEPGDA